MNAVHATLATVLAAAARGDAKAAAAATALLARAPVPLRIVTTIVDAAINLDDRDFIAAVVRLAIVADLPPPGRVNVSWRLALAGFAEEASAVVLADPRMLTDPLFVIRTIVVLREVVARAAPSTLVAEQAGALLRRLLPVEEPPFVASPHVFPLEGDDVPRLAGDPSVLHAAPGLPGIILEESAGHIAAFERMTLAGRHPEVRMLTDVFVNRAGQIWNREGRLFRAYNRPVPPASREAEVSAPEIADAVLATETHNNIFHWFAEWFPSLAWRLEGAGADIPVLLRDDAAPFVQASLELGAAGPVPLVTAGEATFVRRLHLADTRLALLARRGAVGETYARVRAKAAALAPVAEGRCIYISRRDTPRRPLTNEAELEEALARRGFDIVTMSGLPFAEQVARVDAARIVVGAHGAGLALLAAARPGRRVVEIVPAVRGDMRIRTIMAAISRMVGHRHHLWLERMPAATVGQWQVALAPFLDLVDAVREERA